MIKKLVCLLLVLIIGIIIGIKITIMSIKIDGVNEVDNGIITLEIFDQLYDYFYEYTEIKK